MAAQIDDAKPTAVFKKVSTFRSTGRTNRKRRELDASSSGDEDVDSVIVKKNVSKASSWAKKISKETDKGETGESPIVEFSASNNQQTLTPSMRATMLCEIDTERDRDSQAQFERAMKNQQELKEQEGETTYKGMSAYGGFYEKRGSAAGNASNGFVRKGPIRGPIYIRRNIRWDYRPDICKDYKETGFCNFGDSCIYLHDRSDYKHGWELEKEWEEGRYGKDDENIHEYEIKEEEQELPTTCQICEQPFKNPVMTKCHHYFCEQCALQHSKKTLKCFVCEKGTMGIFSNVKNYGKNEQPAADDSDLEESQE